MKKLNYFFFEIILKIIAFVLKTVNKTTAATVLSDLYFLFAFKSDTNINQPFTRRTITNIPSSGKAVLSTHIHTFNVIFPIPVVRCARRAFFLLRTKREVKRIILWWTPEFVGMSFAGVRNRALSALLADKKIVRIFINGLEGLMALIRCSRSGLLLR